MFRRDAASAPARRRHGTGARRRGARKRFGQHFLEPAWAVKVVRAVGAREGDTFLEIGPGAGALTRPLTAASACLIAFEIDRDLAADLRADLPPNVTLVEGDFLDITSERLRAVLNAAGVSHTAPLRVAGNLPYNVASAILFKLVELHAAGLPLLDATVMLQREVANRLLAPPSTREYGVLSVLIRHQADVVRLLALPPGAFRPAPRVHSTVVRLRFHEAEPPAKAPATFTALTQAIFTRRRKTLNNALLAFEPSARIGPAEALRWAAIDGSRRPETLTIAELVRLSDVFAAAARG
jgi:16S rRNA (adenine1518-N6/adenine1519-N6)-dimethyltransferase